MLATARTPAMTRTMTTRTETWWIRILRSWSVIVLLLLMDPVFLWWDTNTVVAESTNGDRQDDEMVTADKEVMDDSLMKERIKEHQNNLIKGLAMIRDRMVDQKLSSLTPTTAVMEPPTGALQRFDEVCHEGTTLETTSAGGAVISASQGFDYDTGIGGSTDSRNTGGRSFRYELLEPIDLELGRFPIHEYDFAYWPVIHRPSNSNGGLLAPPQSTIGNDHTKPFIHRPFHQEVSLLSESPWWKWWFVFMGFGKKKRSQSEYERMGNHAFAGGSHGEVWRGRRMCPKEHRPMTKTTAAAEEEDADDHSHNDNDGDQNRNDINLFVDYSRHRIVDDELCRERLILKRLKIAHGEALLEAGLREIYFGNTVRDDRRFTTYVDHFFRKGTSEGPYTDLWIVFKDAGRSLRSYLYTPVQSGDFVLFQHSDFWTRIRMSTAQHNRKNKNGRARQDSNSGSDNGNDNGEGTIDTARSVGRAVMRTVLQQILMAAARLHDEGIVHRDIKPSNVLCRTGDLDLDSVTNFDDSLDVSSIKCVLGDFSSAWDSFTDNNLYAKGPSAAEQTEEYSPPEAMLGSSWIPFNEERPSSYDSWSIGVLALELLLGTPNVFSVDQRTRAVLTHKMQRRGATERDIKRALYLAALSQFCIFLPDESGKNWPMRFGDPLYRTDMVKQSCTLEDFHQALRARDPLGVGFHSETDTLLHLIWNLLAWDPLERYTAAQALRHPYFAVIDIQQQKLLSTKENAVEFFTMDPRMDVRPADHQIEFTCPKCGRTFTDWRSCHRHANSRRHARFCVYDRSVLPSCLNAHSLLPTHPYSGYCDVQGRRRTIEDFHSIHLHNTHQFYGVFDGHNGNLAAKFAASTFHERVKDLAKQVGFGPENDADATTDDTARWKDRLFGVLQRIFHDAHTAFLEAVSLRQLGVMNNSGTTVTFLYRTVQSDDDDDTDGMVVFASLGDSRAVLSSISTVETPTRQNGHDGNSPNNDWPNFAAVQLTFDHVASDPTEAKLVEGRGGTIVKGGGIDRVGGKLAITRSIGDAELATYLSRDPHVVAMSESEVRSLCYRDGDGTPMSDQSCFAVLASDGLWDVMSNQEVIDMAAEEIRKDKMVTDTEGTRTVGAFQRAAERLTQEAYMRGSTDNIGVCVVGM